jgi:hypothetical protein
MFVFEWVDVKDRRSADRLGSTRYAFLPNIYAEGGPALDSEGCGDETQIMFA